MTIDLEQIVGDDAFDVQTTGPEPTRRVPLIAEMLLERPSGDIFG